MKANLSTGWPGVEWNEMDVRSARTKTAIAQNVGDSGKKQEKMQETKPTKKETSLKEQRETRKKVAHLMASIDYWQYINTLLQPGKHFALIQTKQRANWFRSYDVYVRGTSCPTQNMHGV